MPVFLPELGLIAVQPSRGAQQTLLSYPETELFRVHKLHSTPRRQARLRAAPSREGICFEHSCVDAVRVFLCALRVLRSRFAALRGISSHHAKPPGALPRVAKPANQSANLSS